MLNQLKNARYEFPRQFWLLLVGMLVSTIGMSMIWPFLIMYVSEKLDQPLSTVTVLMTISSACGITASFIAGPIIDRVGRKWVMVLSLGMNALGYLLMSQAQTLQAFALIMAMNGAVNPIYRIGADAMMADTVPPEKRVDAYSLLRMSNNLGVAIGPALGGFLAGISYTFAFYGAAAGLLFFCLLIAIFAMETLPNREQRQASRPQKEALGGYLQIFKDWPFISMVLNFTLVTICATLIWVLLGVYAKSNYGITESYYGWIPTTNALMVVFLQYPVTQVTKRFRPLAIMAVGAFFYAIADLSIAFGAGFWAFWMSMVIMTLGELVLVPTSSTYVANLAPADKRGRYMSIYSLSWPAASGVGPVFGGYLNDAISPRAIWFGGAAIGLVSVVGFSLLNRFLPRGREQPSALPEKAEVSA